MKIHIKGTNLDITPSIREYIEMRVAPLEKYMGKAELGADIKALVEIGRISKHHGKGDVYRTEINIDITQNVARVEKMGEDVRATIDAAVTALKGVLVKYKEKNADY